jgi:hypothetical protein
MEVSGRLKCFAGLLPREQPSGNQCIGERGGGGGGNRSEHVDRGDANGTRPVAIRLPTELAFGRRL